MRIAFAILKLFPGGGLQRDCVAIARKVVALGHEVVILTAETDDGDFARDLAVTVLPVRGWSNHGRQAAFSERVGAVKETFDLLVGFNKLARLDLLYCADPSIGERIARAPCLAMLPRYRTLRRLEGESFRPGAKTTALLLSRTQREAYSQAWHSEPDRLILLPPAMTAERRRPGHRTDGTRESVRGALGLGTADRAWLAVCVQPNTKGLDRTVAALRACENARLLVAGLAATSPAARKVVRQAERLGVAARIRWLGHREDMAQLMAAADLLVHPARYDTTGTVILEAIINGLPVVATSVCGYAEHVAAAPAGIVLAEPFAMATFLAALESAALAERRAQWSLAGAQYGEKRELYEGYRRAAEIIVAAARDKVAKRHPPGSA